MQAFKAVFSKLGELQYSTGSFHSTPPQINVIPIFKELSHISVIVKCMRVSLNVNNGHVCVNPYQAHPLSVFSLCHCATLAVWGWGVWCAYMCVWAPCCCAASSVSWQWGVRRQRRRLAWATVGGCNGCWEISSLPWTCLFIRKWRSPTAWCTESIQRASCILISGVDVHFPSRLR